VPAPFKNPFLLIVKNSRVGIDLATDKMRVWNFWLRAPTLGVPGGHRVSPYDISKA
jgi:hypothetical protein